MRSEVCPLCEKPAVFLDVEPRGSVCTDCKKELDAARVDTGKKVATDLARLGEVVDRAKAHPLGRLAFDWLEKRAARKAT